MELYWSSFQTEIVINNFSLDIVTQCCLIEKFSLDLLLDLLLFFLIFQVYLVKLSPKLKFLALSFFFIHFLYTKAM